MVFFEVYFSEMSSVKESITWRWCHLRTVCIACCLNLFGDCHSPGSDWALRWVLRVQGLQYIAGGADRIRGLAAL